MPAKIAVLQTFLADAIELHCDICNAWLGYVYEENLTGSYFFCGDCKQETHVQYKKVS